MENRDCTIGLLINDLHKLGDVVFNLLRLYERCPWLNEQVNIESIIPMSLDEWHLEINTKIAELQTWHKDGVE